MKFSYAVRHPASAQRFVRRYGSYKRAIIVLISKCPNSKLLRLPLTAWMLRLLLIRGNFISSENYEWKRFLFSQKNRDNFHSLTKIAILAGADLNWRLKGEFHILMNLKTDKYVETVRFLLAHGADPNAYCSLGCTVLSDIVADEDSCQTVQALLEGGADPNLSANQFQLHEHDLNISYDTCLITSTCSGSLDGIRLLLKFGANIDQIPYGSTAEYSARSIASRYKPDVLALFEEWDRMHS